MTIIQEMKSDFKVTYDFWVYAWKTGIRSKYEWPKYRSLLHLDNECAFCEYYVTLSSCNNCPLGKALGECGINKSAYGIWDKSTDELNTNAEIAKRKKCAVRIAWFTRKHMKQKGLWEDKI
jgi:tRNA(Arg) A34 adenosine deaminase TadA